MANEANLELIFRNLKSTDDLIIKKLFLVKFIDPVLSDGNLTAFLCLMWRYNHLQINDKTTIVLKLNGDVRSGFEDVRYLFGEKNVLPQLWPNYRLFDNQKAFTDSLKNRGCSDPRLASFLVQECHRNEHFDNDVTFYMSKNEILDHIYFPITEVDKFYNKHKKELIISPHDLNLPKIFSHKGVERLNKTFLPCFAIWVKWTEQLESKSYKSFSYDVVYTLEVSHDSDSDKYIQISELDVYCFMPREYELDSQACNYPSPSRNADEDFELEKSYSQKRLEYFHEWEKLGIKSHAAFRIHKSEKFRNYFRIRFESLKFSFTVVDRDSRLTAGLYLTISTMIISVIWEMGHDKIDNVDTLKHLSYLTPDAIWFVMNFLMFFGAVRFFFYRNWFTKQSSKKEMIISIGVVTYLIYYGIFFVLNVLFKQPISIGWLNNISSILFKEGVLVNFIILSVIFLLINKIIFRNLYRKFKIELFR